MRFKGAKVVSILWPIDLSKLWHSTVPDLVVIVVKRVANSILLKAFSQIPGQQAQSQSSIAYRSLANFWPPQFMGALVALFFKLSISLATFYGMLQVNSTLQHETHYPRCESLPRYHLLHLETSYSTCWSCSGCFPQIEAGFAVKRALMHLQQCFSSQGEDLWWGWSHIRSLERQDQRKERSSTGFNCRYQGTS